jgi:hypothetical protein
MVKEGKENEKPQKYKNMPNCYVKPDVKFVITSTSKAL